MKNNFLYITLILLSLTYASCSKVSDSLQRDIIITDSILFDIPIITKISDSVPISNIESLVNFNEQVSAPNQGLSIANLTAVKLTSFRLNLMDVTSVVDTLNNFGNLQSVKIQIVGGAKADSLAKINIPSPAINTALELTPVISPEILKNHLSGTALRYNVIVRAKKVTTTSLQVKATATYTATLSR